MFKRPICILWFLALFVIDALAQSNSDQITEIADLKKEWLTFDSQSKNYVPFIDGSKLERPYIGFFLNIQDYQGMLLQCCVPNGTGIYIENSLVDYATIEECLLFDIDSLSNIYSKDQIFVSLYQHNFDSKRFVTDIVVPSFENKETVESGLQMIFVGREPSLFTNFFIVVLLILMAFYAALLNLYPRVFREFFNFNKAFALKLKEEKVLTPSVFSRTNLLFFLGYGMVISFLGMVFWHMLDEIPAPFPFVDLSSFTGLFQSWIKLSLLILIVLCLKYILIASIGTLFNHRIIAPRHFYDFYRLSHIFLFLIAILAIVLYIVLQNPPEVLFRALFYGLVLLLSLRVVIIFLKLLDSASFRNFQLFSYLCTTEILPLVIGVNIFL